MTVVVAWMMFLVSVYLSLVLGVAGLAKVVDRDAFVEALREQQMLPPRLIALVSILLPLVQIIAAFALISGILRIITASVATCLFALFLVFETIVMLHGHSVDCGCYSSAHPQKIDKYSLSSTVIIAAIAALYLTLAWQTPMVAVVWRVLGLACYGLSASWLLLRRLAAQRRASPRAYPTKG